MLAEAPAPRVKTGTASSPASEDVALAVAGELMPVKFQEAICARAAPVKPNTKSAGRMTAKTAVRKRDRDVFFMDLE